jgi:hypothetical protein
MIMQAFSIDNDTANEVTVNSSISTTISQTRGVTVENSTTITTSLPVSANWLLNFAAQVGITQGQSVTNLSTYQITRTFYIPEGTTIPAHSRLIGTYKQYSKDFLGDVNHWNEDLLSGLYLDGQIRFTLHGYSGAVQYSTVPIQ